MALMRSGARIGAVGFLLGLFLAGPQAAGVAVADDRGGESPSVSARTSESVDGRAAGSQRAPRQHAGRPSRSGRIPGSAAVTELRGTVPG
ncbi:MAG: hypothetical protein KIH64_015850, partial [Mycobacterium sp.]|nr:hypothetical protein [Mycobacterium sp.]